MKIKEDRREQLQGIGGKIALKREIKWKKTSGGREGNTMNKKMETGIREDKEED